MDIDRKWMVPMITRRYEITLEQLPKSFCGCRFVFLSDLHGCEKRDLLGEIQKENPDYVLIGGDLMKGDWEFTESVSKSMQVAEELVLKLVQHYPVYYSYGNHECKLAPEVLESYRSKLETAGVHFIVNDHVELERNGEKVMLHGLCLERSWFPKLKRFKYSVEDMEQKLGKLDSDKEKTCHILLAHHPFYFDAYKEWGADLVLAGHIHGGIARLPFIGGVIGPDFLPFPPYSGGIYDKGASKMIVSCGLGAHTIKLRFFNPPELTSIILN